MLSTSIFGVISGLIFVGMGYSLDGLNGNTTGLMIGILGIVFVVRGVLSLMKASRSDTQN